MIEVLIFLLAASIGSFLNVVIYRLPRQISLLRPASHCPQCKAPVKPWHNIPILGYLLLRGRCAGCGARIPLRYLLVEIMTPALVLAAWALLGPTTAFIKLTVLIFLLIPVTFIDLDHRLILNKITLPGIVIGLALSIAQAPQQFYQPVLGMLAGGGFLWLVAIAGRAMYGEESMGGGDIKLGAMLGAFMTPATVLLGLFLAFFLASVFAVAGMSLGRLERRSAIPFGPFIALGALVSLNFHEQLLALYLGLIGY
ncbi:MAG TPA: prepilin peptidase [Bacteroidetes bacterium]|nr:prepilin peptidase [Bacteroidota bacterium]